MEWHVAGTNLLFVIQGETRLGVSMLAYMVKDGNLVLCLMGAAPGTREPCG